MAEFTPQQKAILRSTARHNLLNTASKTGKTAVLIRRYLNCQEKPDGPIRALFVTANALASRQIRESLQRITALDWSDAGVGTLAEIGYKLMQRYYAYLGYTRAPRLIPDPAAAHDRDAACLKALQIQPDPHQAAFKEQCDQEYVQGLRRKNVATTRSLIIEIANLFVRRPHPELPALDLLVADNAHDLTLEELLVLTNLQRRASRSFLAGNSNLAIFDRHQQLDPENWGTLIAHEGFKTFPLCQCFTLSPALGLFLHQLAAHNSKRIYENHLAFAGQAQTVMQLPVQDPNQMQARIIEMESQSRTRNRLLVVVLRNAEDAREMAGRLRRPVFLQKDKHHLWMNLEPPRRGIVCTTPYEAAYLRPDYVILPNCLNDYWPYQRERNLENTRRAFLRATDSARRGVYFLVPEETCAGLSPSPFLVEGNKPIAVVEATNHTAALQPARST